MRATMHERTQRRIYISHSQVDTVAARKLRNILTQRLNCRVFISEEVSAGGNWQSKLRSELSSSDIVLALLTPRAVESNWVLHELGAAWALQKTIIPVITQRHVLNNIPIPLGEAPFLPFPDLNNAQSVDGFVNRLEQTLPTLHPTT